MTPTPRIAHTWCVYCTARLDENPGLSLQQVCLEIAAGWQCSVVTARKVLDPSYAAKHRETDRRYQRRRYAKRKKKRQESRRRRTEDGEEVRRYERAYHRLTRPNSQTKILAALFSDAESVSGMTLNEIVEALPRVSHTEGVRFQPATIETRLLHAYIERQKAGMIRGPPWLSYDDKTDDWMYSTRRRD